MSKPIIMWAALMKSPRGDYILAHTARRLRKESIACYLDNWIESLHQSAMERVRFARVEVKEIT